MEQLQGAEPSEYRGWNNMAMGSLLDRSQVAGVCALWAAGWLALGWLYQQNQQRPRSIVAPAEDTKLSLQHIAYSRRLVRSQAYACAAVLGASWLMWRYRRSPGDLFEVFSREHQVLFAMAVGHWVISIWEDYRTWAAKGRGLNCAALCDPSLGPLKFYIACYAAACLVYVVILWLQRFAILGCLGLLFELPMLWLNHRELATHTAPSPAWLRNYGEVLFHWQCTYAIYIVTRGSGTLGLYIYAMIFWRPYFNRLPPTEQTLYHAAALFGTLWSCSMYTAMHRWCVHDVDAAAHDSADNGCTNGTCTEDEVEEEDDLEDGDAMEDPSDPNARPVQTVPYEMFVTKTGKGESRELWVGVNGVAYDLTKFLPEHPGGENVLHQWAGRDASEEFNRLHSYKAKALMVRYMVGTIDLPYKEYRILEHVPDEQAVWGILGGLAISVFLQFLGACAVARVAGPAAAGDVEDAGDATAELLRVVLLAFLIAVAMALFSLSIAPTGGNPLAASLPGHTLAISLLGYLASFCAARFGPGSEALGLPVDTPSILELGAVFVYVLQAGIPLGSFFPSTLLWLLSWSLRVMPERSRRSFTDTAIANPFYAAYIIIQVWASFWDLPKLIGLLMPAVALGACFSTMLRQVGNCSPRAHQATARQELRIVASTGFQLAGLYGLLGLFVLRTCSPEAALQLGHLWNYASQRWLQSLTFVTVSAACFLVALVSMLNAAFTCSPAFAARFIAFTWFAFQMPLQRSAHWLCAVGLLLLLTSLAQSNRERLREASEEGRFADIPPHVIGAQACWDRSRVVLANIIWRATLVRLQGILHRWLPRELRMYACELCIPNFGPEVSLGFSCYFQPAKVKNRKKRKLPKYFVCNVGNMAADALSDIQRTMNNLIDVWKEFQEPDMEGLLANVVAVWPLARGHAEQHAKELNLSVWEEQKYAWDWYVRSPGHKKALLYHHGGVLRTFGNLLASLVPTQHPGIRHQDRCQRCARVIEARRPGQLAPSQCPTCGGQGFRYPVF